MSDVFNFNGLFGKIAPGMCRIDFKGRIAVKTSNGYKAYDLNSQRLVNCSSFCFDLGEDVFFLIPTSDVEVGDIILVNKTPRCVIDVKKKSITVLNYENSTIEEIVPERHIFMGNTYFYGKIISPMSEIFSGDGDNMLGNFIQFKMMSSMMGGTDGMLGDGAKGMNALLPLMMMKNNCNPFGDLFGGFFKPKKKNSSLLHSKSKKIMESLDEGDEGEPVDPDKPEEE